jgi:hypothetical protein
MWAYGKASSPDTAGGALTAEGVKSQALLEKLTVAQLIDK